MQNVAKLYRKKNKFRHPYKSEWGSSESDLVQILEPDPILFLCFINDLHLATSLFTLMFADDTFSAKSGPDLNNLISEVNDEINKMAIWFRANKLAVNISKTKYMIFRMRGKKLTKMPLNFSITKMNRTHLSITDLSPLSRGIMTITSKKKVELTNFLGTS
jgi:hypothetical protein